MAHQKHAKLKRPEFGQFSRNELAIIGTPCGNLKRIAFGVIKELSSTYNIGYIDADHKERPIDASDPLYHNAQKVVTNNISQYSINQTQEPNSFQFRQLFNEQDLVLVNGNHYKAKQQIVVIDPRKEESLSRKLDRLTDVQCILVEGDASIPDYLTSHLPELDRIPRFSTHQIDKIAAWINEQLKAAIPKVKGLVLAGGKSQRMGHDKTVISYHGKPQREHLLSLLEPCCESVQLSCRHDQQEALKAYPILPDKMIGLGPFGAILTAFQQDPQAAWLVVASDLPHLNTRAINYLLENRDPSKLATAFHNSVTGFPDPLFTIWEPKSYPTLLQFLSWGYSCPRKVLINSNINEIHPQDNQLLLNVNTPEELDQYKRKTL